MSQKAVVKLTDADLRTEENRKIQDRLSAIFQFNGYDPTTGETVSIQDALDIQNAAFMIPRAMTQIVQEGIEPLLIGEKLLQKIQYKPGMTTVFPAM